MTVTIDDANEREEAGFTGFTILPVEHESFRFYRLDP